MRPLPAPWSAQATLGLGLGLAWESARRVEEEEEEGRKTKHIVSRRLWAGWARHNKPPPTPARPASESAV